jgi:hypothetical protein
VSPGTTYTPGASSRTAKRSGACVEIGRSRTAIS